MSNSKIRDNKPFVWHYKKFYRPPTGFSEGEFMGCSMLPENLIAALEHDGILLPEAEPTISKLNKLLDEKELYKSLRKTTPEIDHSIKRLEAGKTINIRKLNRLLIETNYPSKTPNKKKWQKEEKIRVAIISLKKLRGDNKYKINPAEIKFNSWKEMSDAFGFDRVTIWRWIENGKIRNCCLRLINRIVPELKVTSQSQNILEPADALQKLEDYKANNGSWDMVAKSIGTTKRTIMRWRKSGNISQEYRKYLYYFFNERAKPQVTPPLNHLQGKSQDVTSHPIQAMQEMDSKKLPHPLAAPRSD